MGIQDELALQYALYALLDKAPTPVEIAADSTLRDRAKTLLDLHKKLGKLEIYPPAAYNLNDIKYTQILAAARNGLSIDIKKSESIHS